MPRRRPDNLTRRTTTRRKAPESVTLPEPPASSGAELYRRERDRRREDRETVWAAHQAAIDAQEAVHRGRRKGNQGEGRGGFISHFD